MIQGLSIVKKAKIGFFKTTPSLSSHIMNSLSTLFDTDEKRIDALLSFIIINKDTDILNTKNQELKTMFDTMVRKSPNFLQKFEDRIKIINDERHNDENVRLFRGIGLQARKDGHFAENNDENIRLFKEGKNCGSMFNTLKERCAQAKELGQTGRVLIQK
ncbi:MAG: hypothetical protein Ta2D_12300 [Rickettsiales bacterium]|nr:MAG: hypothetical protein Ta2D_12300 [Rickettsiales bacterium]